MNKQRVQLKMLATTDLHAHVTNYDYYRDEVVATLGLIGLADLIQNIRANHSNTILLDNGDFLQGNPIGNYLRDYSLEKMHPMVRIMNELNYDVGTLGNHEFDFGMPFLEKMLSDLNHPIVNANIVNAHNQSWIQPYAMLDKSVVTDSGAIMNLKIGVIGALPPQVTMWNHKIFTDYAEEHDELHVNDIVKTIEHYVPIMRAEGADIIIVLAHSGFTGRSYVEGAENIINFLADINGIDAIVAGHAHGIFPDNQHHFNTPIIMPGSFGQYLGIIDFDLQHEAGQWQIIKSTATVESTQQCDQLNHPLFALIEDAHVLTCERMNAPIGENQTVFSSALSLVYDDASIQVIADAQLWYAKKLMKQLNSVEHQSLPILSAVAAFKVGGRKNAPYDFTWVDKGIFTFRNVADLYPFNNQLALVEINGAELREWLECANSIYFQIDPNCEDAQPLVNWEKHRGYNRDVIKGIEYKVDITQARRYNGECMLVNPDSYRIYDLTRNGLPIQDDERFILATNQYRAYSGKFPGSGEHKVIALSADEIPSMIENYLSEMVELEKIIEVKPANNWQLSALDARNILYETAPNKNVKKNIKNNYKNIKDLGISDAQKFAIYEIESFVL